MSDPASPKLPAPDRREMKQLAKSGLIGHPDAQIWPDDVDQSGWVKSGLQHGWYIEDVYDWPSFEIVKWVGANQPWSAYGEGGSSRDVNRRLIVEIVDAFVETSYTPKAAAQMRSRRADAPPAAVEPE